MLLQYSIKRALVVLDGVQIIICYSREHLGSTKRREITEQMNDCKSLKMQ
jgi:hypothetical protein